MNLRSLITSTIISTVVLFAIIMEVAISAKHTDLKVVSKKSSSQRSLSYKSKKNFKLIAEAKMQRQIAKN